MAIIPGVTVDYTLSPRIITIPVAGTPVDVTVEDLQDTLQAIETTEQGIAFPKLRVCEGGAKIGTGRYTGFTMTLQNAQVVFQGQTSALTDGAATADEQNGKILTDSAATFETDCVTSGCTVVNWTTRAAGVVTEVISQTQLRHVVLSGGSRATWASGDEYRVTSNVKCGLGGGNITAVDALGADMDPVMPSPGIYGNNESATSAALLGMASVATECAAAVMDETLGGHTTPGSLPVALRQIKSLAAKAAV